MQPLFDEEPFVPIFAGLPVDQIKLRLKDKLLQESLKQDPSAQVLALAVKVFLSEKEDVVDPVEKLSDEELVERMRKLVG